MQDIFECLGALRPLQSCMYLMKIGLLNKRVIYIKVIYPSIPVKYVRERESSESLCLGERTGRKIYPIEDRYLHLISLCDLFPSSHLGHIIWLLHILSIWNGLAKFIFSAVRY